MTKVQLTSGEIVTVHHSKVTSRNAFLTELCEDVAEHLPLVDSGPILDRDRYIANGIIEKLGGTPVGPPDEPDDSSPEAGLVF